MTETRKLIVNGTEYELAKLWGDVEVDELMNEFQTRHGDYVHVTLNDGVLHVLVTETTQVSFVIRANSEPTIHVL